MDRMDILDKTFYIEAGGIFIYTDNNLPLYMASETIRKRVIEKTETSFLSKIEDENLNNNVIEIYLKSSNKCNLRCEYCFRKENTTKFDENIVRKFVKFIVEKYNYEKIKIDLTGDSEPLMEIPKLEKIISICNAIGEEFGVEFVYSLNSNGTVFDEEIKEFLYKNSILFGFTYEGVSLDKYKRVYKDGQVALYDVEKNIKKYKLDKNRLFGISMTLTSEHQNLVKEYKNLINLCSAISMRIVNTFDELGVNEKNLDEWKSKYRELAMYLMDRIKEKKYENIVPILLFCKLNYAPFCELYGADFGAVA